MKRRNAIPIFCAIIPLLVISFMATVALAQDDGGGRSILADGAGNRALSMGGAYVGLANDASAAIWNPGGLGLVPRQEFQATHTDLLGLGFNEQYASYVLPDWRWGVASLTFRRFAVGGIEGRDDRNILTDTDLKDSETELTLGYGHAIGEAWSVGVGLKMRKQSLAGFSDSGLGVDLGLLVRPLTAFGVSSQAARNLSLGVAVRNAVEPSLKLNADPVPDPTGIRAGGAYRYPIGGQSEITLAMDVEKTGDMDAHFHGGLEFIVVPALALRVGTNQSRLVAGAGLEWRDIGIDYQFEDSPLEALHRFGLSLKFGKTTEEARQFALAKEEKDLKQRLDDAYARKQNQRKSELLSKADTALQDGDVKAAANHIAMIKVMDPEAPELPVREKEILMMQATEFEASGNYAEAMVALTKVRDLDPSDGAAQAMLDRVRTASDTQTRRTTEIRTLLDAGMDALAAGDLSEARGRFQRVQKLAPDDREAQGLLAQTNLALKTRLEGHLAQVRILTNAGQFDRAKEELGAARRLDPDFPGIEVAAQFMTDRKVLAMKAPEVPNPVNSEAGTPEVVMASARTAQEERDMDDLYRRGMAAMETGQKEQASHFWELVWSMDPNYQNVTEYLAQNYLAKGMEFFVAGDLPEAVTNWEAAVRVDPADPKALGYLERAREQTDRMRMLDD